MTNSVLRTARDHVCLAITVTILALAAMPARADDEAFADGVGRTPPRLSFLDGEVSFWRPGADDWSEAHINTPLAPGDQLYTGSGANLELQIGPRAYVRAAGETQLGLENQEPDYLQMRVAAGNLSVDVRTLAPGHTVEIDTPHAAFTIDRIGYYRARVDEHATTFIVRRGGRAGMIVEGSGDSIIDNGQQAVVRDSDLPSVEVFAAPELDEWDGWNYGRTDRLLASPRPSYVADEVYGVEELADHGSWRDEPTYGPVWVPRRVPVNWAPYSVGRWTWDPYYHWTWVSGFSWGWAPFHYGRWVYLDDCWGWAPGPRIYAPAYAPALVGFFGGGGVSVGIGVSVGWVSLGWGEPLYPWWGPAHYHYNPWWGGWGGPRYVHKTKIVNKTKIIHVDGYKNARHRDGVVVVRGDRFGRGDVQSGRIKNFDRNGLRHVRGDNFAKPTRESLRSADGRGRRPPGRVLDRQVVGTRQPRDSSSRLRAAGLNPTSDRTGRVRLVDSPRSRRLASVPTDLSQRRGNERSDARSRPGERGQRAAIERPRTTRPGLQAPASRGLGTDRPQRRPGGETRLAPPVPRSQSARPSREDRVRSAPTERQSRVAPPVPRAQGSRQPGVERPRGAPAERRSRVASPAPRSQGAPQLRDQPQRRPQADRQSRVAPPVPRSQSARQPRADRPRASSATRPPRAAGPQQRSPRYDAPPRAPSRSTNDVAPRRESYGNVPRSPQARLGTERPRVRDNSSQVRQMRQARQPRAAQQEVRRGGGERRQAARPSMHSRPQRAERSMSGGGGGGRASRAQGGARRGSN